MDDRAVLTAIVYVLTSGCARRYLPSSFGVTLPPAHRRFGEWTKAGFWRKLHPEVLDELGTAGMIDWSKIHMLSDRAGLPLSSRWSGRSPRSGPDAARGQQEARQTPMGDRKIDRMVVRLPPTQHPIRALRPPLLRLAHPRCHTHLLQETREIIHLRHALSEMLDPFVRRMVTQVGLWTSRYGTQSQSAGVFADLALSFGCSDSAMAGKAVSSSGQ